jgi:hypothetical protein
LIARLADAQWRGHFAKHQFKEVVTIDAKRQAVGHLCAMKRFSERPLGRQGLLNRPIKGALSIGER